jgi:peptidyl-prolyl cis-trans isomerase C
MIAQMFKMTRPAALAAVATAALLLAAPGLSAQTATPDKVVATVDGMPITEQDLDIAAEDVAGSLPAQITDAQKRDYLVGYVSDLKLVARAAREAKLDANPDFERKVAFFKDKLLLDDYLGAEAKKAATPEAMQKLFDESIKGITPEQEARARHILVEKEDEANAIVARLKAGEDFAKIAADVSKDPGSGKEGGDLGYFTKDRMVPEFAEAAFKLKPGEISAPVKSQFGWHIIKLEDLRTKPLPSFADVKDQIAQYVTRKAQTDVIVALRAKGKLERLDTPAPAAPATPAPAAAAPAAPKP